MKIHTPSSVFMMVLLAVTTLLTACTAGPIETLTFPSADGSRKVVVTGEQKAALDPIMVTVTLHVPGGTKPFSFEHQANSLTKENCKMEWSGDKSGTLTLTMSDGVEQVIDIRLDDNEVAAVKRITQ